MGSEPCWLVGTLEKNSSSSPRLTPVAPCWTSPLISPMVAPPLEKQASYISRRRARLSIVRTYKSLNRIELTFNAISSGAVF